MRLILLCARKHFRGPDHFDTSLFYLSLHLRPHIVTSRLSRRCKAKASIEDTIVCSCDGPFDVGDEVEVLVDRGWRREFSSFAVFGWIAYA